MMERFRRLTTISSAAVVTSLAIGVVGLTTLPARAQFFWDQPRYSADDVARIAMQHGFRPMAPPVRNDNVYLSDVVDQRGRRERLIVNAESGEILQRFYLGYDRRYRRYADPSLPRGPMPPGSIPDENDEGRLVTRLAPDDGGALRSQPDEAPQREFRPRLPHRPRYVEQTPERPRETPVESAPLAPRAPKPAVLRSPRVALPAASQAALPPATPAETPTPAAPAAPVAAAPDASKGRAIAHDPLAIPGSREQDRTQAVTHAKENTAATQQPATKPPGPPKTSVPVVPLE